MPSLPIISGKQAVKAFLKAGFEEARQSSSHVILKRDDFALHLSIPQHDELKKGTLRRLIRDAGMTIEEFCELL
jgi:predicted RNA binding protein YcfA (HicA-like mRNA interferase family)